MKRNKFLKAFIVCTALFLFAASLSACGGKEDKGADSAAGDSDKPVVRISMDDGKAIDVELDREVAPITVDNFLKLVSEGFYDGLTFHRIMPNFMIQGGDPSGDGSGDSGETIKGEFSENGYENPISHERGVISMARGDDPDSASCQFFITNADATYLDGGYAAFGHVVAGMDVVDEISAVATEANAFGEPSKPIEPIVIKSIKLV